MNSEDVICGVCATKANKIPIIVDYAKANKMTPNEYAKADGTYSTKLGKFICDKCFISIGGPRVYVTDIEDTEQVENAKEQLILKHSIKTNTSAKISV